MSARSLLRGVEQAVYAAAFVAEYNRLHDAGVHAEFRRQAAAGEIETTDVVRLWEEWCATTAHDDATLIVLLRRTALRNNRGDNRR